MTLATQDDVIDAEIITDEIDAEKFDLRFQSALGGYAEARRELIDCIEFVRGSDVAERMGFKSRGDYIAERVAGLNVKWAVEDRRSLVELMAPTMSQYQVAEALDIDRKTVRSDMRHQLGENPPVERRVESSDGKTRTYTTETDWPEVPEPEPETRNSGENRETDMANGLRNDSRRIANGYMDYLIAVAKNLPKENLSPGANGYVIQALRDNLADITEVTKRAIAQIEGEGK